jgi:hypothetical protein
VTDRNEYFDRGESGRGMTLIHFGAKSVVEIRMIFAALLRKIMQIIFENFNENIFLHFISSTTRT